MNDDERYGIGDAIQYLGFGDQPGDYPMPTTPQAYLGSGDQEGDYPMPTTPQAYLGSGDQPGDYDMPTNPQTPGAFGGSGLDKFLSNLKSMGGKAGDYLSTPQGLMSLLSVLGGAGLGYSERRKPSGGGGTQAFKMPTAPQTRTIEQGKYGPIARYAAHGGLMHAYANGGHVRMEDGGFVMTKRAVDGAGGPQGIAQLVPGSRPIQGPGTGTSDSIPASIHGPNGVTPAKVSNGEAYLPRAAVQQAGGPERMYALMNSLQRRA
jgi:hypothetical protein